MTIDKKHTLWVRAATFFFVGGGTEVGKGGVGKATGIKPETISPDTVFT